MEQIFSTPINLKFGLSSKNLILFVIIGFASLSILSAEACYLEGQEIYINSCQHCHGENGDGNGTQLPVKIIPPELRARDFTKGHFKVADCDTGIASVIRQGGAVFGLNPLMSGHSEKYISDEKMKCVIEYIREFSNNK